MGSQWAAIGSCQRPWADCGQHLAAHGHQWAGRGPQGAAHGPSVVNGPGLGQDLKPTQELSPNLNPNPMVGFLYITSILG